MTALQYVFGPLLFLTSFFLIVVVLLQRGKGGGLVGALGGSGGQSAFGTKFGDRLMWVTYGVAVFWMLLILCSILLLSKTNDPLLDDSKDADGALSADVEADKKDAAADAKKSDSLEPEKTDETQTEEKPTDDKANEAKPETPTAKPESETKPESEAKPEAEAKPEDKPADKPETKPEETPKAEEKPADPAPPATGDAPK